MPDQHNSAPRPKPFIPTAPPFRGPATAARPGVAPLGPDSARPPAPFVARRAARPATPPAAEPIPPAAGVSGTSAPAVTVRVAAARVAAAPVAPAPAVAGSIPSEPVSPTPAGEDQHLYAHDPFASGIPAAGAGRRAPGDGAAPDEAPRATAGLAFLDTGIAHAAAEAADPARTSEKPHRVALGPAAVLESLAARVRAGALVVSGVEAHAGDAATLAAVLVALLRDESR